MRGNKVPRSLRVPFWTKHLADNFLTEYGTGRKAIVGVSEAHSGLDPTAYSLGTILTFDHVSLIIDDLRAKPTESFPEKDESKLAQHTVTPFVGVVSLRRAEHVLVGYNQSKERLEPVLVEPSKFPQIEKLGELPVWHAVLLNDPRIAREMPFDDQSTRGLGLPKGTAF